MYKVVIPFTDLLRGGEYKAGDTYPHSGEVDEKRALMLMSPTAQRGSLIEKVAEAKEERKKKKKEA